MIKNGIMISQDEAEMLLELINFNNLEDYNRLGAKNPQLLCFLNDFRSMVRDDVMQGHIEAYHEEDK